MSGFDWFQTHGLVCANPPTRGDLKPPLFGGTCPNSKIVQFVNKSLQRPYETDIFFLKYKCPNRAFYTLFFVGIDFAYSLLFSDPNSNPIAPLCRRPFPPSNPRLLFIPPSVPAPRFLQGTNLTNTILSILDLVSNQPTRPPTRPPLYGAGGWWACSRRWSA